MSEVLKKARNTVGLLFLVLIASCASSEIKLVGPPMSGDEIKKLIVGNTIQGPLGREMYDWYYQGDGQVTGVVGASNDDSGTWSMKNSTVYCHEWDQYFDGERLCYEWYKQERAGEYVMVNVDADRSGNIEVWKVIKGNPYDM